MVAIDIESWKNLNEEQKKRVVGFDELLKTDNRLIISVDCAKNGDYSVYSKFRILDNGTYEHLSSEML